MSSSKITVKLGKMLAYHKKKKTLFHFKIVCVCIFLLCPLSYKSHVVLLQEMSLHELNDIKNLSKYTSIF